MDAEREMVDLKKAQFMMDKLGERVYRYHYQPGQLRLFR